MSNFQRRAALERVSEKTWIKAFRADAVSAQDGKCAYCTCPITMRTATFDHLDPRSNGGSTHRNNGAAACLDCNSAKGSMSAAAFKQLIRKPRGGAALSILRAHIRLRIWSRTHLANRRIMAMVS